jgi:lipoprotein-anchoring transpeptidase ErfK/SrfK
MRGFFPGLLNLAASRADQWSSKGDVMNNSVRLGAAIVVAAATAFSATAAANPFEALFGRYDRMPSQATAYANPNEDVADLRTDMRRQIVSYRTGEAPGTIIVDTPSTYLYLVLPGGKAIRYGIGVGREGFTWSGVKTIERKAEWPDWTPPPEMIQRQPYLPRFVAGGPSNPLGARAMYLSGSVYRIHGTNAPSTIGSRVSSGCIRMANEDVVDLYNRIQVGTKVVVLPMTERRANAPRNGIY